MMSKKRKGQHLIVEEMILFGLGLMITLGFLSAFQGFEKNAKEQSSQDQIKLIGEMISARIIDLVQSNSEGTVSFEIPETIGGSGYYIKLQSEGIFIQSRSNKIYMVPLFGLEKKYLLQGAVESNLKKVSLTLKNKTITLGI